MLSCLVNFVKLSDAQLPRQSRKTIRCTAASLILWTIRCSGASSVSWNYPMLNCLVNSRETIRCSAASSNSWNYTMLSKKRAGATKSPLQRHKYSQKWNCKASFPIPTFMYCTVSVSDLYIPISHNRSAYFAAAKKGGPLLSERDRTWKEIKSKWWKFEWIQCYKLLSSYSTKFFREAIYIYIYLFYLYETSLHRYEYYPDSDGTVWLVWLATL